jgi:hypothetical protein
VAIHETEHADTDVEQPDQRCGEPCARIARSQALPDPEQRHAEQEHAAADEVPDDIDHRTEIGLDRKRIEDLMHTARLEPMAEGAKADDQAVDQEYD